MSKIDEILKMEPLFRSAYEAGQRDHNSNKEIDDMLERGTKNCPERPSFEKWFSDFKFITNIMIDK